MWRELKFENTKSSCYWRWAGSAIRSVRWCTSVACRSSVTFHKTTPSQQQTSHVPSKLWLRALEWATSNRYEILMTTTTSLYVSPFKGSNKRVVTGTDRALFYHVVHQSTETVPYENESTPELRSVINIAWQASKSQTSWSAKVKYDICMERHWFLFNWANKETDTEVTTCQSWTVGTLGLDTGAYT